MTRVTFITTLHHNVGDDFVREGIIYLLERVLGRIEVESVHKHLPITARAGFDTLPKLRIAEIFPLLNDHCFARLCGLVDALPILASRDKICRCDLLVQSGAPIFWMNSSGDCSKSEWWGPLIERRWRPRAMGRPFLNLAGGTCQAFHSDGLEFKSRPKLLDFIRLLYDTADLTTVRDQLSADILRRVQREPILLPCTSLFAADRAGTLGGIGDYVVLNYMPGGGHYGLNQPIDAVKWQERFVRFARRLMAQRPCIFACHSLAEVKEIRKMIPQAQTYFSRGYEEYLELYQGARWGVFNRVHGAFAMAGCGRPAALVGSDSRAQMGTLLRLPLAFVNDATDEWLSSVASKLDLMGDTFVPWMKYLKRTVEQRYLDLLRTALKAGTV
jgi:hypothetical protein